MLEVAAAWADRRRSSGGSRAGHDVYVNALLLTRRGWVNLQATSENDEMTLSMPLAAAPSHRRLARSKPFSAKAS
jgi:hypothetical protein